MENSCPLCRLWSGDMKTHPYWVDNLSICVGCITSGQGHPMVVIKRHDNKMTQEEDEHIVNKALEYFGDKFVGLTKHPEWGHAHYHIILK